MTIDEIIARLEEATELQQALVLEEAVKYAHERRWIDKETAQQALAWVECGAFESAALSLVPEGCAWQVGCEIDFTPTARVWGHDIHADEFAATPALALCIASFRARQP